MKTTFFLFLLSLSLSTNDTNPVHEFDFPYDMATPMLTLELDDDLEEISGLSLYKDLLAVNNDEEGKIFFVNKVTGAIETEIKWHKDGDYEGIEVVEERIFVVKSSGTVYEVENLDADQPAFNKHKYFLDKENDVEALGLDVKNNRLLLGCKGKAGEGEEYTRTKAIYAFNLATNILQEEPVFLITLKDVLAWLGHCRLEDHVKQNLKDFFNPNGEVLAFCPSSLAIHPITGHIYITSSKGKLILVLDENGKILHIEKLDKEIHPQPEGLCFEPDGTMWISNESKKDKPGMIYKFSYRKDKN